MLAQVLKRAVDALAARRAPSAENVLTHLETARVLAAAGDAQGAEDAFAEILRQMPDSAAALHGLGRLRGIRGELTLAEENLAEAVRLKPDFADAWVDLGNVFQSMERWKEAAECYRKALCVDETSALAWCNLGLCQQNDSDWENASKSLRWALDLNPHFPMALRHWVAVQDKLGRSEETRDALEAMLRNAPDFAEAHAALGFVLLKQLYLPADALAHFDQALALGMETSGLQGNRGIALQDLGRVEEALASYDQALALEPDNRWVIFHRSLARLLVHDFGNAWPDYQIRLLSEKPPKREFPFPQWDGSGLADKTLLIYAEQGLGDEIMFASCLPDVIGLARHCVIECSERLAPMFRRSFPTATVHGGNQHAELDWLSEVPPIDYCIPVGSLPLYLRRSITDFPDHRGYLKADGARTEFWREFLDTLGPGLKVGVSWRGGIPQSRQSYRSLPLERLLPVLKVEGAHFVNLQYGACEAELAELRQKHGQVVHHFPEAIADYDETAALVSALDLVASVCTAVIHLGGALGKPVWVMAPVGPEWRYGIRTERMPWYPANRVFRSSRFSDWDSVIETVRTELCSMAMLGCENTKIGSTLTAEK